MIFTLASSGMAGYHLGRSIGESFDYNVKEKKFEFKGKRAVLENLKKVNTEEVLAFAMLGSLAIGEYGVACERAKTQEKVIKRKHLIEKVKENSDKIYNHNKDIKVDENYKKLKSIRDMVKSVDLNDLSNGVSINYEHLNRLELEGITHLDDDQLFYYAKDTVKFPTKDDFINHEVIDILSSNKNEIDLEAEYDRIIGSL